MINDQDYWNKFYEESGSLSKPSSFACHVEDKYFESGKSLLELGCGNGRDAIYFAEKGKKVSALDLSTKAIQNLSSINIRNADFFNQDFSQLSGFRDFDYVYSRFTLHSIDEETELSVLQQLPQVLRKGGLFLMEARSLKDETLDKAFGTAHFRRYLDYEETVEKIAKLDFKILEKIESQGLSPHKAEDPYLIRLIAEKR
ncbi:MAG: class I SAM-dependent methyltransferase [Halioglobus sp.]